MSEHDPHYSDASRRTFLIGTGLGAGASALGVAGLVAGAGSAQAAPGSSSAQRDTTPDSGPALQGSLVAHVTDIASGRMVLLLDGHEVVVTDPSLTRSLARKAR